MNQSSPTRCPYSARKHSQRVHSLLTLPSSIALYLNYTSTHHTHHSSTMQPPTIIHSPPKLDSFTKLADYQASTPATFYDSKPVLHYYGHRSYVLIAPEFLNAVPIFDDTEAAATNGVSSTKPRFAFGQNIFMVELFVTSQYVALYILF